MLSGHQVSKRGLLASIGWMGHRPYRAHVEELQPSIRVVEVVVGPLLPWHRRLPVRYKRSAFLCFSSLRLRKARDRSNGKTVTLLPTIVDKSTGLSSRNLGSLSIEARSTNGTAALLRRAESTKAPTGVVKRRKQEEYEPSADRMDQADRVIISPWVAQTPVIARLMLCQCYGHS